MLKPFSDDALQKMHGLTDLPTSAAANLRHDMVKAREEILHCDRDEQALLNHWQAIGRESAKPPTSRANEPPADQGGCNSRSPFIVTLPKPSPGDVAGT